MMKPSGSLPVMVTASMMCACASVWAWNDTGHMVTGIIAWDHLDASTRAEAVALLREHPRFQQDFLEEMPDDVRAADASTQELWIFCRATTWPDIARGFGGGLRDAYHRSTWHYINDVTFLSESDRVHFAGRNLVNDSVAWRPDMPERDLNIVQALKKSEATLRDPLAPADARALALTWVFHLVGDLHQPLHSTSLYAERTFPGGDRGGNSIPTTMRRNLHSYWDSLLGYDDALDTLREAADRIGRRVSALDAWTNLEFETWYAESVAAVREHTYSEDVLDLVRAEEARLAARDVVSNGRPQLKPFDPSTDYVENAIAVAEARVMAAGVRLAGVVESLFGDAAD